MHTRRLVCTQLHSFICHIKHRAEYAELLKAKTSCKQIQIVNNAKPLWIMASLKSENQHFFGSTAHHQVSLVIDINGFNG